MLSSWSLLMLLALFAGAASIIWYVGIKLSDTTDVLANRLGLSEALGGLILLAIATNPSTSLASVCSSPAPTSPG